LRSSGVSALLSVIRRFSSGLSILVREIAYI
jgi:hypothetical protein